MEDVEGPALAVGAEEGAAIARGTVEAPAAA